MISRSLLTIAGLSTLFLVACGGVGITDLGGSGPSKGNPQPTSTDDPGTGSPTPTPTPFLDYFEPLGTGATQFATVCSHGNNDRFTKWYCASSTPPSITGLKDLLTGLQLDPTNTSTTQFVLTGHSSSLVTRHTTAINPRALIFTPSGTADYVAVGFVRGDHLAEIAAFDTVKKDINFFLVHYHKACDTGASITACPNSERFTLDTESGWMNVDVYNDQDINNTPLDCLQCHEPQGVGTLRMLRMQDRKTPWTHWFRSNRPSGVLFQAEFSNAHTGEAAYATIPFAEIIAAQGSNGGSSDPALLEKLVEGAGFSLQPNEFNTSQVEKEDATSCPNGVGTTPCAPGPTWLGQYKNSVAGFMSNDASSLTPTYSGPVISTPFFEISPYDPTLLSTATTGYQSFLKGTATDAPDMTDIFTTDPQLLSYLGFTAATTNAANVGVAGAAAPTGLEVMEHRCSTCHFGQFPGITRNRFDVHTLEDGTITSDEAAKVLQRVVLDNTDRFRMPPLQFSELSQDQIKAIQTFMGAPAVGAPNNDGAGPAL